MDNYHKQVKKSLINKKMSHIRHGMKMASEANDRADSEASALVSAQSSLASEHFVLNKVPKQTSLKSRLSGVYSSKSMMANVATSYSLQYQRLSESSSALDNGYIGNQLADDQTSETAKQIEQQKRVRIQSDPEYAHRMSAKSLAQSSFAQLSPTKKSQAFASMIFADYEGREDVGNNYGPASAYPTNGIHSTNSPKFDRIFSTNVLDNANGNLSQTKTIPRKHKSRKRKSHKQK